MTTWLVTGANRGIGRCLVEQILRRGDQVIAAVRPAHVGQMGDLGPASRLRVIALDAGDRQSVETLAARVNAPIDILINNAGVLLERNVTSLADDLDWSAFEESFRVNAIAPLFITRSLLPLMSTGSKMLAVSSSMGSISQDSSDTTSYRASKAALNRIVRGLARDLKPRGIAVAALHPGWVQTDMGGTGADIPADKSAAGIIAIADKLTVATTGQFLNYDGRQLPW